MAQLFAIHPTHPQPRLVRRAAAIVRAGGLIAYPTDSCYALGCAVEASGALARLRRVRGIDERHRLTLMCRDLAEVAAHAMVGDESFRFLKVEGSYTFILPARRHVPRRVTRKKTIGVRIASHPVALALLADLDAPMISTTLHLAADAAPLFSAQDIRRRLERNIDLVIDSGECGVEPSTIIDLTGAVPAVLRKGKGSLAPFSLVSV